MPTTPPIDYARMRELSNYPLQDDGNDKMTTTITKPTVVGSAVMMTTMMTTTMVGGTVVQRQATLCRLGLGRVYIIMMTTCFWLTFLTTIMITKHFLSILGEATSDCNRNRFMGGPQPPPNASNSETRQYKAQRKAFTDATRRKLLKMVSAVDINCSPQKVQATMEYTGDQFPHIRLMNVAEI